MTFRPNALRRRSGLKARLSAFMLVSGASVLFLVPFQAGAKAIAINYDPVLARQGFASPIVELHVNGKVGRFIVDTGAPFHVLSRWFAEEARISGHGSASIGDSSGGTGRDGKATISFDLLGKRGELWKFSRQDTIITELPPSFQKNRIAGIFSPQQLLGPSDGVLIDFSTPLMHLGRLSALERTLPVVRASKVKVIRTTGDAGKDTLVYVTDAQVDHGAFPLVIDTGAADVSVGIDTRIGAQLRARAKKSSGGTEGIHGQSRKTWTVPGVEVRVFGRAITLPVTLQPISSEMPADGMLGMAVLKDCRLVLGAETATAACQPRYLNR